MARSDNYKKIETTDGPVYVNDLVNVEPTAKLEPIHKEDTVLHWDEFMDDVRNQRLTDWDGFGHLATETMRSDVVIYPSDIKGVVIPGWATHVVWFNR